MASISYNRVIKINNVPYRQISATTWVNQVTGQEISNSALAFLSRTATRNTVTRVANATDPTVVPLAGISGACCKGGTCIGFYTSALCSATGGVWAGSGVGCTACVYGAYCTGITCNGLGYIFQETTPTFIPGGTCAACLYGICCTPNGCLNNGLVTQSQCAAVSGTFYAGVNSCNLCTIGSCCTGGGCTAAILPNSTTYKGSCPANIGQFITGGTCSDCSLGACCVGGETCQGIVSRAQCAILGGTFYNGATCSACNAGVFCNAGGTSCATLGFRGDNTTSVFIAGATCNACERGTCCRLAGNSFISEVNVSRAYCSGVAGTFFKDIYNSNACATGSCCIPNTFNCTENTFRYDCAGVFNQGRTCGACENGKCCFRPDQEGYPCQNISRWECEFRGGRFFGGETCDGNSCMTYACCSGTTCTDVFYGESCNGISYEGVFCSENPCLIGSCCTGGTCMPNMRARDCINIGGIFTDAFDCSSACVTGPACRTDQDTLTTACIEVATKAEYGNIEIFPGRTCDICDTGVCCTGDAPPFTTRGLCERLNGIFFAGATETGCDRGSFCTGAGLQRNCIGLGYRAESLSSEFIQGASCDQCAYGSCCKGGTCIGGTYMDQQTCVATGGYFFPNAGCTSCITGVFCKDVVMNIPCVATGYFGQALGVSFFSGQTCSACDVGACCTGGSCIGRVRRQYCNEISGEFVLASSCDACLPGIYCTGSGPGITCQGPGKLYENLGSVFIEGGTCSDCNYGVFCTGSGIYSSCFNFGYKAQNLTSVFIQGGTCSDCHFAPCCTGGTCIGITSMSRCALLGGKTFSGQTCSACDKGVFCTGPYTNIGQPSLYTCLGADKFRGENLGTIFISGATCTECSGGVFCTGSNEKKTCIGSGYSGQQLSSDFRTTNTANCNLCIHGACCTGGTCAGITSASYCTSVGGTFYAGFTCSACSTGTETLGACCTGGSCAGITSSSNCKTIGGLFYPGTTCSSCDYGAFCQGLTCSRLGYRAENISSKFIQGGTCSSCIMGVCCKNGSCLQGSGSLYDPTLQSQKECQQIEGAQFVMFSSAGWRGCSECAYGVFCTGSSRYGSTCDSFGIYADRKTGAFIAGGTCSACVPSICCRDGKCADTTDYDVSLVLINWGKTGPTGTYFAGDYDGDGVVGVLDLGLVLTRWYGDEDICRRNGGIFYRGRTCGNCDAGSKCSACDTGVYCTGSGFDWTCLGVGSSYDNLGGIFIQGTVDCEACEYGVFCTGPSGISQTCDQPGLRGYALSDRFVEGGTCDDCIIGVCCETGLVGYMSTAGQCTGANMSFFAGTENTSICNSFEQFTDPLGICCRGITCSEDGTASQCVDGEFTELTLGLSFGISCQTKACDRGICCKESDVSSVTGGQCLGEMSRIACVLAGGDFFSYSQGATCSNCEYIPMLGSAVASRIRQNIGSGYPSSEIFNKNNTGQTGNEIQPRKENKFKAVGNWTDKADTWLNRDTNMYGQQASLPFGLRRTTVGGNEVLEFVDINIQNNSLPPNWKPWWTPGTTGVTFVNPLSATAASGIFDAPPPTNLGLKSVNGHTLGYILGVGTTGVYPVPRYIQLVLGYDNPDDLWHNIKLVYRFYGYATNGPRYSLVDATRHARLQSYQTINEFPNPNPFIGLPSPGGTFEAFSGSVLIGMFAENPLKHRVRPFGSCCVGATCIGIVTKDHCEFAGGTFNEGSRCYACYPELIFGNCCTGGTHAGYMNLAQCNQLNGTFFKGNTFDAQKCVYGTICKQDRTCLDITKPQSYYGSFSDAGGNFFVPNYDLGCAACNFGLCCAGGTCYGGQPKAICDQYNGTLHYDESACTNNCDMGICCKVDGGCGVYTNRAACNKPDEVFLDNFGASQPCTACESLLKLTQHASGVTYTYVFNKSTTFGTFFDGSYWVQESPNLKLMKVRMTYTSLDKSRVYNYNSNTIVRNLQLHPNGYKGTVFVHGLMKNPRPVFYRGPSGEDARSIHALQSIVYGAYDEGWMLDQRSDSTENPNNYREFDLNKFNDTRLELKAGGITMAASDVFLACTTNFDPNRMTFPQNNSGFPYQVFQSRGEVLTYGVINCLSAQNAALAGSTVCFRPPTSWQSGQEHNKPIYPVSLIEGKIPGQTGHTLIALGNSSTDKAVTAKLESMASYSQVSEFGTGFNYQHNSPVWAHYGPYTTENTYGEQWTAIMDRNLQGLWAKSSRANQNLSLATRRLVLQRLVQYGIDSFGAMKIWAHLAAGAGQKAGRTRSWAMIAGYYLGITAMRNPEQTQLENTLAVQEFLKDYGRVDSDLPPDTLFTVGSGACVSKGEWYVYQFGQTGPQNNYRGLRTMLARNNAHERQTMVETSPSPTNLARYHDYLGRGYSFTISGLGIVPFSGVTGMTFSTSGTRALVYSNANGITLSFGAKSRVKLFGNFAKIQFGNEGSTLIDNPFAPYFDAGIKIGGSLQLHKVKVVAGSGAGPTEYKILDIFGDVRSDLRYDGPSGGWQFYLDRPWQHGIPNFNSTIKMYPFSSADSGATRPSSLDPSGITTGAVFFVIERRPYKCPAASDSVLWDASPSPNTSYFGNSLDAWATSYGFMDYVTRAYGVTFEIDSAPIVDYIKQYIYTSPYNLECLYPWYGGYSPSKVLETFYGIDLNTPSVLKSRINFARDFPGVIRYNGLTV